MGDLVGALVSTAACGTGLIIVSAFVTGVGLCAGYYTCQTYMIPYIEKKLAELKKLVELFKRKN